MKNTFIALLLGLMLFLAGCFDITEEVTFLKNGQSGTNRVTIDMSSMMGMLSMFMPDSLKESMSMDNMLQTDMSLYTRISGISNVRSERIDEYKYAITYDFATIDALNKAQALDNSNDTGLGKIATKFKGKKGKLYRQTSYSPGEEAEHDHEIDDYKEMFDLMGEPKYRVIYHFPNKIKKVKLKGMNPVTTREGNTITMEYNFMDFMKTKGMVMDHYIKY
ncbi:MAG TPA: hypothetical protein PK239_02530 [Chitinophagales bacterium]|nr:hypothetical protein [Chitinophagales bacterium]HRK26145.1 hypothetical protein [Chitinophagales bacterium]